MRGRPTDFTIKMSEVRSMTVILSAFSKITYSKNKSKKVAYFGMSKNFYQEVFPIISERSFPEVDKYLR